MSSFGAWVHLMHSRKKMIRGQNNMLLWVQRFFIFLLLWMLLCNATGIGTDIFEFDSKHVQFWLDVWHWSQSRSVCDVVECWFLEDIIV